MSQINSIASTENQVQPVRAWVRVTKKTLWWALSILSFTLITLTLAALYILNPRTTEPQEADAVFVLAFGEERIVKGRELGELGVAQIVVFSRPSPVRGLISDLESGKEVAGLWFEECGQEYKHYLALCVEPEPETTFGEAKAIADLAREYEWESIAVVTDIYHLGRATALLETCFSGEVYPVATYPDYSVAYRAFRTAYEMGAYVKGFFSDHSC